MRDYNKSSIDFPSLYRFPTKQTTYQVFFMDSFQLSFTLMAESDIPDLTPVMTRAFDDDSQKHLGKEKGGPPGYDNGDFPRGPVFLIIAFPGILFLISAYSNNKGDPA